MKTPHFDVEKELKNVRPKLLTNEEKEKLWSNIYRAANDMEKEPVFGAKSFSVFRFFNHLNRRVVFATLLIVFLVWSSRATFAAADSAKPGDFLFPLDLASEKIRISLSFGDKKNELKIKFARERLAEAKEIVAEFFDSVEAHSPGVLAAMPAQDNGAAAATTTNDSSATTTDEQTETSMGNVESVNSALIFALERIERTKSDFEEDGNSAAALALEIIIGELTGLAQVHSSELDKFETTIKDNGKKLKIEVKASSEDFKARFKFEEKPNNAGKSEVKISVKDSKSEFKVRGSGVKIEFKIEQSKDDGDKEEDEEENNQDNDNDNRGKNKHKKDNKEKKSGDKKTEICHSPPGNHANRQTIKVSRNSLDAHLDHGDTAGECGDDEDEGDNDDNATSTPDTTPPGIFSLSSDAGTTTAEISWDTDEEADSKVWYGTTTPLNVSGAALISSTGLITEHSLSLSGLFASTTYYFVVTSMDAAMNTATSSESLFTTLPEEIEEPEDTSPPAITGVTAAGTTATSTRIVWSTDEDADSRVLYSTSTPVTLSLASAVTSSGFVTSHELALSNLTASSTYYYTVSSSDPFANTATSTEYSFSTL